MKDHMVYRKVIAIVIASLLSLPSWAEMTISSSERRVSLINHLTTSAGRVVFNRDTERLRFIGSAHGKAIPLPPDRQGILAATAAERHIATWAPLFGIANPQRDLSILRESDTPDGRKTVRYTQRYAGLPVVGGELLMTLASDRGLLSMTGRIAELPSLATTPTVTADAATETALSATSKWHAADRYQLLTTTPELSVYDPQIFHDGTAPARLVWRIEVSSSRHLPVRELVLVDARSGRIALHFNQVDNIKNRETYSSNATANYMVTLQCNEADGDTCTNGADADADAAHLHAGDAYDFYATHHGRDSLDNAGMTLISNVHWDDGGTCPNAFWDGTQMVYCDGMPLADDVVAHELTHGVTEHSSNLFYYYQPGAINEALSDIWGEFVDLENGRGTDTAAVRWQMGEDATAIGGTIRNMKDPPQFGDPDKITSPYYVTGADDNGGVHTNSGVANKAAYLMTDGDTFNGQTITGLGITKVAAIFYEAQTNILTSASDYMDLQNALHQGCQNIIGGVAGITVADCDEVQKATLAVEMGLQPSAGFNPEAEQCPGGNSVSGTLFSDDFEAGMGQWLATAAIDGDTVWGSASGYATSGTQLIYGNPGADRSDESIEQKLDVALPAGRESYLWFAHAFELESPNYDGGLVEYSIDGGSSWHDAGSLIDSGKSYTGRISTASDSPEPGSRAFIDLSHGYVSSRVNLSTVAGENIRLRFRLVTDTGNAGPLGWTIDDVSLYSCNRAPIAAAGSNVTVPPGASHTLDGSQSHELDSGDSIASYNWTQLSGTAVTLSDATAVSPSFTAPDVEGTLSFRLTVTDTLGASATDTVQVAVIIPNNAPTANAGSDGSVTAGALYTLDGSLSSDPDSGDAIAGYSWTQLSGTAVTLSDAGVASPTFTAPNVAGTLSFRLTVTDTMGASATDSVQVAVSLPVASGGGGLFGLWSFGLLLPLLFRTDRRRV
jgi:bacillolysin